MKDLLSLLTLIIWPVVPLFWIPVHGLSRIFKKIGIMTYIMPAVMWTPLAWLIYRERAFLLGFKLVLPPALNAAGLLLLAAGTMLHIWTGLLLGFWGLVGLPEISRDVKGRLVSKGPFSLVRHPTYFAHTVMFSGIFLFTGVAAVGILTLLDFMIVTALIIPLEEKELLKRFGEDYRAYMEKVPSRFFPPLIKKS